MLSEINAKNVWVGNTIIQNNNETTWDLIDEAKAHYKSALVRMDTDNKTK